MNVQQERAMARRDTISCDLYDYIEIACMRSYQLRVLLKDGVEITGTAKTTRVSAEKLEYLVVDTGEGDIDVAMVDISTMTAMTVGATFSCIDFNQQLGNDRVT